MTADSAPRRTRGRAYHPSPRASLSWLEFAACAGDPEPDRWDSHDIPPARLRELRAICAACPVAAACLDDALATEPSTAPSTSHTMRWGVRAGTTPEQRDTIVRDREKGRRKDRRATRRRPPA